MHHPADDRDELTFLRLDPEAAGRPAGTWRRSAGVLAPARTTWRQRPVRAGRGAGVALESREHGVDLSLSRAGFRYVAVPLVDLRTSSSQPSALLRALADDLGRSGTHDAPKVAETLLAHARFLDYDDHGLRASPLGVHAGRPGRSRGGALLDLLGWF